MFETSMTLSLEITIMYWVFLFPVMYSQYINKTDMFSNNSHAIVDLSIICADHLVPILVHFIEWSHNMIEFDFRHYFSPFVFYLTYAVFNYNVTMIHGQPLYWTNDWINKPLLAFAITVFVFILEVICFTFLHSITKAKLGKYHSR